MEMRIRADRRDDAFAVRRAVFMDEQGYENEFDAIDDDPSCIHVTLYCAGELAGCARAFPAPLEQALAPDSPVPPESPLDEGAAPDKIYLLGRVAVLPSFRRRGLASEIVRACDERMRASGALVCKLHAQEYVRGLYERLGYEAIAEVDYEDEGQPHVWMAKRL